MDISISGMDNNTVLALVWDKAKIEKMQETYRSGEITSRSSQTMLWWTYDWPFKREGSKIMDIRISSTEQNPSKVDKNCMTLA